MMEGASIYSTQIPNVYTIKTSDSVLLAQACDSLNYHDRFSELYSTCETKMVDLFDVMEDGLAEYVNSLCKNRKGLSGHYYVSYKTNRHHMRYLVPRACYKSFGIIYTRAQIENEIGPWSMKLAQKNDFSLARRALEFEIACESLTKLDLVPHIEGYKRRDRAFQDPEHANRDVGTRLRYWAVLAELRFNAFYLKFLDRGGCPIMGRPKTKHGKPIFWDRFDYRDLRDAFVCAPNRFLPEQFHARQQIDILLAEIHALKVENEALRLRPPGVGSEDYEAALRDFAQHLPPKDAEHP